METYQFLSLLIAVIGSAGGVCYYLGYRLGHYEGELKVLRNDLSILHNDFGRAIKLLASQFGGQLTLTSKIISLLHKHKTLDDRELSEVMSTYTSLAAARIEDVISRAETKSNPITKEEAQRLREYIKKARQGIFFSAEEVKDYNKIVEKIAQENGPEVWPLEFLGAFLTGLFQTTEK